MAQGPFDVRHPLFRPLWRRIVVTSLCLGWAVFEWYNAAPFWALLFGVSGLYLAIQFFLRFRPEDYE